MSMLTGYPASYTTGPRHYDRDDGPPVFLPPYQPGTPEEEEELALLQRLERGEAAGGHAQGHAMSPGQDELAGPAPSWNDEGGVLEQNEEAYGRPPGLPWWNAEMDAAAGPALHRGEPETAPGAVTPPAAAHQPAEKARQGDVRDAPAVWGLTKPASPAAVPAPAPGLGRFSFLAASQRGQSGGGASVSFTATKAPAESGDEGAGRPDPRGLSPSQQQQASGGVGGQQPPPQVRAPAPESPPSAEQHAPAPAIPAGPRDPRFQAKMELDPANGNNYLRVPPARTKEDLPGLWQAEIDQSPTSAAHAKMLEDLCKELGVTVELDLNPNHTDTGSHTYFDEKNKKLTFHISRQKIWGGTFGHEAEHGVKLLLRMREMLKAPPGIRNQAFFQRLYDKIKNPLFPNSHDQDHPADRGEHEATRVGNVITAERIANMQADQQGLSAAERLRQFPAAVIRSSQTMRNNTLPGHANAQQPMARGSEYGDGQFKLLMEDWARKAAAEDAARKAAPKPPPFKQEPMVLP